ncbi:LacI family DNA-binding transcriptional regulator [Amycolatopsis sp. A133]|uniref:LacI family DNA-binding transcriptional regulator n=1 Tax=Amycolatopsis sp. A133 TaxID=3064472 RepID=UPI0027F07E21|nr:LacI family DNA-binding transcriptional regulator [Amycolatopsis sp. A133]MDQ7807050.1 LacI family DNA-binding transcriptional regulator [Amycolatopsis sp. A133]
MRVTIAEVARRARVSKTTVSRVLNNKADVDAATAIRVREVIAATGYIPSAGAVGLARGVTRTVGMLVPGLTWPWMGEVLQGVADVVESKGYGLLLSTANRGADSLGEFSRQVSAKAFDGLLLVEPPDAVRHLRVLHDSGLPVVVIDDRGRRPAFPSVGTDNRQGGAAAARHLLDTGRTRLATVTGPRDFGCTADRLNGFNEVVLDAGRTLDPRLIIEGDFTSESGEAAILQLLETGPEFDAVFAHNDLTAAGVLAGLRKSGRAVPGDVAVVGFDDIPLAAHTQPPLTTIRQPLRQMGETAAGLLLDRLAGAPSPEGPLIVPTALVVRESTQATVSTPESGTVREPSTAPPHW